MASTDLLFLEPGNFSIGFRLQDNLTTQAATGASSDWEWMDAIVTGPPTWTYEEGTDPKSSGQRGAKARKSVGRKVGTWPFRLEMPGQLMAYDPTSDSVEAVGAWKLLFGGLGGSAASTYDAAEVASSGSAANVIEVTDAIAKMGTAWAVGTAGAVRSIGFVESQDGTTVQLAFDMRAVPVSGDSLYSMLAAWPEKADAEAYTFRLCGDYASADYRYIGCVISECLLAWDNAGRCYGDFTVTIYAGEDKGTDGGIRTVSGPYDQIDEYSGHGNAHLVIAQTVRTALDDGTAESGVCGTQNHSLKLTFPHRTVTCPGADERVGAVSIKAPDIMASFDVDGSPDWDDVDGENLFKKLHRSQEIVPYAMTVGAAPGRCLGVHIPGGLVSSCQEKTIDGALGYAVEIVPGQHTGSGASTDAGNKPAVVVIG